MIQTMQMTTMNVMKEGFDTVANQVTSEIKQISCAQTVSLSLLSHSLNFDLGLQDMMKQASNHINAISISMQAANISIQQAGEIFQSTITKA